MQAFNFINYNKLALWHITIVYISRVSVTFDVVGGLSSSYGHPPTYGQYVGQTQVSVTITFVLHFPTKYLLQPRLNLVSET